MAENGEKYVLSIDLGTSGSKMAIVSVYGEVMDFEFKAVPLKLLPGGGAEQDPSDWWNAIMTTSKRLLARGTVAAEDIVAVCKRRIASEPHTLSDDGDFSWEEVECLGACGGAPMMQIDRTYYENLTPELVDSILDGLE